MTMPPRKQKPLSPAAAERRENFWLFLIFIIIVPLILCSLVPALVGQVQPTNLILFWMFALAAFWRILRAISRLRPRPPLEAGED
ncbi:MAG: hypothetical protein MUE40_05065 [Anaerolineae bacterium]|jgi:uncharacterized membrane protein YhaH (DUF805 family)|nr:hypothetical protein [Anaerolineae bacterium]